MHDETLDMPPFVEALRPHQWVKNLLVLFPLFFTDRLYEAAGWIAAATAFGSDRTCCCSEARVSPASANIWSKAVI